MKISIILTVLNEGSSIAAVLDSLLAQSRAPDEIVIVDGGSRDNTVEVLNGYSRTHPEIKVFIDSGVNIAKGRNLAISRAAGDIIAVTDGGCRPDADWLRELVAPFEKDPSVDAVAGRVIPISEGRFEYYSGLLTVPDLADDSQKDRFYGRSSAFRRKLWETIGGYPEWLYTAEDTLFAIRAGTQGFKIVYAPDSVLYWRPRPTLVKTAKMFYLYGRGNGRIRYGDMRGAWFWLKYYLAFFVCLLAGIVEPWAWVLAGVIFAYLCHLIVVPNLRRLRDETSHSVDRFFYVPIITLTRNFSTNLGFVRGWLEYNRTQEFRERLNDYMKRAEN